MSNNDERFFVSGWDDDVHDIDKSRNPDGIKSLTSLY